MFKKISLALLAGASSLGAGLDQASAFDAAAHSQPSVIYAGAARAGSDAHGIR